MRIWIRRLRIWRTPIETKLHIGEVELDGFERLAERMIFNKMQGIGIDDERLLVRYGGSGGAIERLQLPEVLETLCAEAGLNIDHERRTGTLRDLESYDLVVLAILIYFPLLSCFVPDRL